MESSYQKGTNNDLSIGSSSSNLLTAGDKAHLLLPVCQPRDHGNRLNGQPNNMRRLVHLVVKKKMMKMMTTRAAPIVAVPVLFISPTTQAAATTATTGGEFCCLCYCVH